jgi:ribosomal protein S18 acetylase RimI-like enzyme
VTETKNYEIRAITQMDFSRWSEMWDEYMQFYQSTYTKELMEHTFQKLNSSDQTIGCLVACDQQDIPIGFLTYISHFSTWQINPVCYLNDLYVKKDRRQSGAAKAMLDKLKVISQNQNWSAVYWRTKPDNHVAREFYDKLAESSDWIVYTIIF